MGKAKIHIMQVNVQNSNKPVFIVKPKNTVEHTSHKQVRKL